MGIVVIQELWDTLCDIFGPPSQQLLTKQTSTQQPLSKQPPIQQPLT